MTTKFLTINSISIKPQNDHDKILLSNVNAMLLSGKKVHISYKNDAMILEFKSDKN